MIQLFQKVQKAEKSERQSGGNDGDGGEEGRKGARKRAGGEDSRRAAFVRTCYTSSPVSGLGVSPCTLAIPGRWEQLLFIIVILFDIDDETEA